MTNDSAVGLYRRLPGRRAGTTLLALRMRYLSLLECELPLDGGAALERMLRDSNSLSEE